MSVSLWLLTESDSELVPLPTLKPSVSHLFKISLNVISWIQCKHWCYLTKKVNDSSCPTVSFVQRAAATSTCWCLSLLMYNVHLDMFHCVKLFIYNTRTQQFCHLQSFSFNEWHSTPTSLVSCFDCFCSVQNFNLMFPCKFCKDIWALLISVINKPLQHLYSHDKN